MVSGRHAAMLLAVALALVACQPSDPDALIFALATPPSVLDPRLAGDAASERVNALLFDRLVELDPTGRPRPAMAGWRELSPTRYRFRLDPGRAPFWDGRLPDANDVAATYRSVLDTALGSPHAGALAHIRDIHVVDDQTIDFDLARADPLLPSRMTLGIVPQWAIARGDLSRAPMGSGRFEFVRWRSDGSLLLRRRSDGMRLAMVAVADPTMRVLKLVRGEAQLLQNDLPAELYGYLAAREDISLAQGAGTTFAYLGFNLTDPLLAARGVREAIALAIDREAIVRHLFQGRASLAESVLRPPHWAAAGDLPAYRHDPAGARALLAAAGFGPGHPLRLNLKTSTDPFRLRIAAALQHQLAAVGIELTISSHEWGTFFGDIKAGRFQLYTLAWVGVNSPDILRYAFHSDSRPPGGANRGGYFSTAVDRLLERAASLPDTQSAALYAAVQRQVHDDLAYVPLWYEDNVAASRGLQGYVPGRDGNWLALTRVRRVDDTP